MKVLEMPVLAGLLFVGLLRAAHADVYLHSPRGSNNRLNEQNVNRDNNNRLFDSQNNNKGGYTVGVDDDDYANENLNVPDNGDAGYRSPPLILQQGAPLPIEWTNQHACGPNENTACEVSVQYMTDDGQDAPLVRDGEQTGCDGNGDQCPPLNNDNQVNGDTNQPQYGNHEPVQWYLDCRARDRNKGLFTADQNVDDDATDTRQNPNGGRSGTECAEERDYFPYFSPTPWRDIVVLTSNISMCAMYQTESQNVADKGSCTNVGENNEADCANAGGEWVVGGAWDLPPPDCQEMLWTRDNHLGNGGVDGYPVYYNWTVPEPTGESQNLGTAASKIVVRLRYNITTGDTGLLDEPYWELDANSNGGQSPVQQDEAVPVPAAADEAAADGGDTGVDADGDGLTLQSAINTNQYGRVFEDRSFVGHIMDEDGIAAGRRLQSRADYEIEADECSEVHNLMIRGKRGNIVQSYPSVEHDFLPNVLIAEVGDCIHLQLWLTDNDPPNNAGEGLPGTGRANLELMASEDKNKPVARFDDQNFFDYPEIMFRWGFLGQEDITANNGGPGCLSEQNIDDNQNEQNAANCGKLNPMGPYYDAGLKELTRAGHWAYQSTRENNFSNRSQKAEIIVNESTGSWEIIVLVVIAVLVFGYFCFASAKAGKLSSGAFGPAAAKLQQQYYAQRGARAGPGQGTLGPPRARAPPRPRP